MNDWHQRSFIPMTREGVRFFRDLKVVPLTAINQLSRIPLFLWAVAVSAALYLGQSELTILPNIEWVWMYILGMAVLLDFIVLLLEKE